MLIKEPKMRLPQFIHRKNLLKSERESLNTDTKTGNYQYDESHVGGSKIRAFAHSIDF